MANFTFHYTASALGMGGVLKDHTGVSIVRSLASVALAPVGGEGFIEMTDYDSAGISFSKAISHVTGYDSAYRTFTTKSSLYMADLNLFGRVKAASLQTSISSTRELLATDTLMTEDPDKALFTMSSMIVGLTIDGVEITPEFDLDLCQCATYEEVGNLYATRSLAVPPANAQLIRTSFVKDLQYTPTDTVGPCQGGFKIPVKNFGTIHIGELIVKPGTRTLNLLRIEFNATQELEQRVQESPESGSFEGRAPSDADVTTTTAQPPDSGTTMLSLSGNGAQPPDSGTMTLGSLHGNGVPSWP